MIYTSPVNTNKTTVLAPIVFGKVLSQIFDDSFTLLVNELGMQNTANTGLTFLNSLLKRWKISPDYLLSDKNIVPNTIKEQNDLQVVEEDILVCDCKKLEIPIRLINKKKPRKMKDILRKNVCRFCGVGTVIKTESLLYKFPIEIHPPNITPKRFNKTISKIHKNELSKISLKVNRVRDTKIYYKGNKYNLDVDYATRIALKESFNNSKAHTLIINRKEVYKTAQLVSMCNATNLEIVMQNYYINFEDIYPLIEQKLSSYWHLFLLFACATSWKTMFTKLDVKILDTISKKSDDDIKNLLLASAKSKKAFYRSLNKNLVFKL